jgi:predicted transcriptional regulator
MSQYLDAYFSDGPSPKFSPYHIWKAFRLIDTQGPISRKKLAETLGLGEGSVRTILAKMTQEELIENSHDGTSLTERGRRRLESMGIEVSPIGFKGELACRFSCAVLTHGTAPCLTTGKDQRDDVVRAGAEGALVMIRKEGGLVALGENYKLVEDDANAIEKIFRVGDDDAVVVGFGPDYRDAERGAVSAALTLCQQSSKCWSGGPSIITKDTEAGELECIALAMHELVGKMPLGMRSRNKLGVRCEDGAVIDRNYTGPNLEEALATGKPIRRVATSGPYAGAPVVVVPIVRNGEPIAVVGIVDFTQLSIYDIMGRIRKSNAKNQ